MKVKVITRHTPSNYGSILQSIATISAIERLGHSCEIINYVRSDERGLKAVLAALQGKPEWANNLLKKMLYIALRYPSEMLAEKYFDRLRSKFLNLTRQYSSVEELRQVEADVYMTGSDQVWGPTISGEFDPAYFLTFAPIGAKKVAYAASFGTKGFSPDTLDSFSQMLASYRHIAVREISAAGIINKMGLGCEGHVLDPTLLFDSNQWCEYIDCQPIGHDYALIYQIHHNPAFDRYAKRVAQKMGLPLYRITPSPHQLSRCGRPILLPSVGKFLSSIKNASVLLTDSFHGTAFAINFNTQFIEFLPNNKTSARNIDILQLTGLQSQIARDEYDLGRLERKIDFNPVNEIIANERVRSLAILKKILEN